MPPDPTACETVMRMHQDRRGGFEGVLAPEPRRELLEPIHGDAHRPVAQGDHAPMGALGHARGEQRRRRERATWWRLTAGGAGTRTATPALSGPQERCHAHPRQMRLHDTAEFLPPGRARQGLIALRPAPVVLEADKGMGGEAGRRLRRPGVNRLPEVPTRLRDRPGHGEFRLGVGVLLGPLRIILDQLPEGHVLATGGAGEGARASGIPAPQRQRPLPRPTIDRAIGLPQGRPPRRRDKVCRGLLREGRPYAGLQLGHPLEARL